MRKSAKGLTAPARYFSNETEAPPCDLYKAFL
jgi:hypothetical protein